MLVIKRNMSCLASVLRYSEYGEPGKVLKMCSETLAAPQNDNLLVKILLAPINPADINTIQGKYPVKPEFPAVPGNECVAEVVEVGPSVKSLKPGDVIIPFATGLGTWRSHAIFKENEVMKVPDGIPLPEAATITVNPCTAYRMLKDFEDLKPGDTVIQNGANSACGQNVIQICKALDVKSVGIVRDRPNIEELSGYLKSLGATEIITEEQCRTTKLFKSGQLKKPKLALNCVGGKNAVEMCKHLDNAGIMVTYGGMSREPVMAPTASLIFKDIQFRGFWMTRWKEQKGRSEEAQLMFDELFKLITSGQLKAPNNELIPFDSYIKAVENALNLQGFAGAKLMLDFRK